MFNVFKYIKIVNIIVEGNLFKIQSMMFAPEQMDIRLVNIEEGYKPLQH